MSLAWRLALRDMRAGGRELWLLGLSLLLGTAALAGIGSLSASILQALDGQSRIMLGGDLEMRVSQRRATVDEAAAFTAEGQTSETVRMRAMAQPDGSDPPVLVTLKAVDASWPLLGAVDLPAGARTTRPKGREALVAPTLMDRMGLHIGDAIHIGSARLLVVGVLANEPDHLGEGFSLGPTVLIDMAELDATGLIQPGSLYESRYRMLLARGADAARIGRRLISRFPNAGWSAHTPANAAEMLRRGIAQLGQFLLLVGLAALAIAGIGVGSGVSAYLGRKTRAIAILKVLGASSKTIAAIFLLQLGLVAGAAIGAGVALGACVPFLVSRAVGGSLPVPPQLGIYPEPLIVAAGLGVLIALLFALPALARARSVPAATLLRGPLFLMSRPSWRVLASMAGLLLILVLVTVLTANDRITALGFVGATGALVVFLWFVGSGLRYALTRLPRPQRPLLRLALANLHRPGASTRQLVVALGLGFSLFTALAVIDTSLSNNLHQQVPAKAPRFFAIDLEPEDKSRFLAAVAIAAPGAMVETVPSLRGTIVALKGQSVSRLKSLPDDAWILKGDRTITWSANVPPRNSVTAGRWWPADYHGPPLVSMEDKAAAGLGLKIGDMITVSVLGVNVPARIAALRKVDWGGFGLNFALVFSPGYIEEAPHGLLASIYSPSNRDGAVARSVAQSLPAVTMIRTGDIIGQVSDLLGQIAVAIRAAAAVTVAAGIVVLVGAVTASGQQRRYDNAVLKMLGGSRGQILLCQTLEFSVLSSLLAGVALILGVVGGQFVVVHILALPFVPDLEIVAVTLIISVIATLGVGLLGSASTLSAKPALTLKTG